MQSTFTLFKNHQAETMIQPPQQIELKAYPPAMKMCFDLLNSIGAQYYALFGGAVRDVDYAARHQLNRNIKDYDIRIWLAADDYENNLQIFLKRLTEATQTVIESQPCPGTKQVHYCFNFEGIELDISVRPVPACYQNTEVPIEAVAINRASESDVAISAVAVDPVGRAWARSEYLRDQENKTLTVYELHHPGRRIDYATRMQAKFPDHALVDLCGEELSVRYGLG